jgi:hypothetical protein
MISTSFTYDGGHFSAARLLGCIRLSRHLPMVQDPTPRPPKRRISAPRPCADGGSRVLAGVRSYAATGAGATSATTARSAPTTAAAARRAARLGTTPRAGCRARSRGAASGAARSADSCARWSRSTAGTLTHDGGHFYIWLWVHVSGAQVLIL